VGGDGANVCECLLGGKDGVDAGDGREISCVHTHMAQAQDAASALTHARFAEKWRAARGKQHPMYQTTAVATAAKATVVDGVRFSRSGEFTKV
jgi:hypothetical protein